MTQIAEHQHCEICGRVVGVGTRFCGPECTARHAAAQKEKKKSMWILLALLVGTLLLFNIMRFL